MRKGYKFKLEPTHEQAVLINKTLGCCRWVYNNALDKKSKAFARRKEKINATALKNRLPYLKTVKPWLKEVDSTALQQAIMHMDDAYANFFAGRAGFPKFKSKHNEVHSYKTVSASLRIEDDKHINLPVVGIVRCRMHRQPKGTIKSATITKCAGNYYISLLCEVDEPDKLPINANKVGIDLGIKAFAVDSNGLVYENPKYLNKSLDKLKLEQQKLSRMTKGSKNYNKQKNKIAKLHLHIANQRLDHAHKLSTKLIRENQIISIEDLDIKGMVKKEDTTTKTRSKVDNKKARAIIDAGWGQFTRLLEYKATWYGRSVIKIGRYVPSSQRCNHCGTINPAVKDLSVRSWVCPHCGMTHNRDYNAAINILQEGLKIATTKI